SLDLIPLLLSGGIVESLASKTFSGPRTLIRRNVKVPCCAITGDGLLNRHSIVLRFHFFYIYLHFILPCLIIRPMFSFVFLTFFSHTSNTPCNQPQTTNT